jgi:hypothetical protein
MSSAPFLRAITGLKSPECCPLHLNRDAKHNQNYANCIILYACLANYLSIALSVGLKWNGFTLFYKRSRLSLSEFVITETELKRIAAAAIIGDSSIPKKGYNTPAATGIPAVL